MSELSRDEVAGILGQIGDAAIAEIIATGITKDGLVNARARVLADKKNHDPGPPIEPGPFSQVVDILERMRRGGIFGEAGSTLS